MKKIIFIIAFFIIAQNVLGDSVSNSYGDPGDAYLEYTISGPDFSEDTDGPPVHIGTYTGEPIHFSGKMVVSRPEGLVSYVTMKASLADQSEVWPKEGEDNKVENKVVELPFDFTFEVPKDYAADTITGNVRLEACGGSCGVYNIDLRVSVPKTETVQKTTQQVKASEPIGATPSENLPPLHSLRGKMETRDCLDGYSGFLISDFSGEVTIAPKSDPDDTRPVTRETVICNGDIIITEGDSSCILIDDRAGGSFVMSSFSTVNMATAEEVAKADKRITTLSGKIWVNVKKMVLENQMPITMNNAIAGTRGTTFILEEDGTTSTLKVIEGEVEFTSIATGDMKLVSGKEKLSATSSGLGEIQEFDIKEEKKNWPEVKNFEGKSGFNFGLVLLMIIALLTGVYFIKKKK